MFYSPVAWLVLLVFTFQCSVAFCDILDEVTLEVAKGSSMPRLTGWFFTRDLNGLGVLRVAMNYLYIYFPLLTMGLFSKELASGSIKLLTSSPVSTTQVVLGKFFAMVAYVFVLIGMLLILVLTGACGIEHFNWGAIVVTVLGAFLTMILYSAIGLFMSSLTRYSVVAAIGSFVIFIVLERIGQYGQQYDGLRDVMGWLSIAGRLPSFMDGLLVSSNVIYFVELIVLFLAFTVIKIWLERFHYAWWRKGLYYAGVLGAVIVFGLILNRPALRYYWDATEVQYSTIPEETQAVLADLKDKGPLTITTYVNLMDPYRGMALPANRRAYEAGFDKYLRFKPDIDFKYVYYYAPTDQPHRMSKMKPNLTFDETAAEIARLLRTDFSLFKTKEEVDRLIDLEPEHYRFLRVFELNGRESRLRYFDDIPPLPEEREYFVAFKRLTDQKFPKVGIVAGHGERSLKDSGKRGLERLAGSIFNRQSWLNQGIDYEEIRLMRPVAEEFSILMIADPQEAYSEQELENLDRYIARGGNLILLVEPESHAVTRPLLERFGVSLMEGCLAQKNMIELGNVVLTHFTMEGREMLAGGRRLPDLAVAGVAGLKVERETDFKAISLMESGKDAWIKFGSVDWIMGPTEADPRKGETVGANTTALALTREAGGKEQRIFICGDADWMSNKGQTEKLQGFNYHHVGSVNGVLSKWMTYGEAPVSLTYKEASDTQISTTQTGAFWARIFLVWGISLLLVGVGGTVCIRRNRQ